MEPFEKAFDQLRREYLAEAGARIAELRADSDAFRGGDAAALSALRTRFHRLVGSGGSYGFPEISSAAREVERWLDSNPPASAASADQLDDAVDRLAVLFSEAEAALRADLPRAGEPRLAVLSAGDSAETAELREALAHAGFSVRQVPPGAQPPEVGGSESAQLVVLTDGEESVYPAAAAWSAGSPGSTRAVLIVEGEQPIDRLRAAVAGVEAVIPGPRAVTDLARFAQRFVRLTGRRQVMVIADEDGKRAGQLGQALGEMGVEVRRAGSAPEVGEHLDDEVSDLIIASASLPGGGGHALARMLRQDARWAGVPVVVIGQLSPGEAVSALRDGADDVILQVDDSRALAAALRARAERGRRIRELVRRDPLTGLLNHGAFVAELGHAAARGRREGQPLALLFAELEHFRSINERHGLAVGDRVLAHAASVVRGIVRASDHVARISGRTFGIVLRGASADGAAAMARKLEASFAEHPYETRDGGTIPVRARTGSAALGPDGTTADELLHTAGLRLMQGDR